MLWHIYLPTNGLAVAEFITEKPNKTCERFPGDGGFWLKPVLRSTQKIQKVVGYRTIRAPEGQE